MNNNNKYISFIFTFVIALGLQACGDKVDSNIDDLGDPVDTAAIERGKTYYDELCVACHGDSDDIEGTVIPAGVFPGFDIADETFTPSASPDESHSWIEYNTQFMPFGDGEKCLEDCATDILAFLTSLANANPEPDTDETSTVGVYIPETAVRRSKNLLTGLPPEASETSAVIEDPNELTNLVEEWIETDEFKDKMITFFSKNLQQTSLVQENYARQILSDPVVDRFRVHDQFLVAMTESMARTALWLIENDRPFNEIATTRTWMMTTQMMAYLAAAENSGDMDGLSFYHEPTTLNNIDFDENTSHSVQIENKMIYTPEALTYVGNGFDCHSDPVLFDSKRRDRLFAALMTDAGNPLICRYNIKPDLFTEADSTDWRLVTMVKGEPADWWDALAFRGETNLKIRTSRTGFFSHPAFFATWVSNEDNDFRVTTNQALIAGLGRTFEDSDTSIPLGDEGLSEDHAGVDTVCYACHKTLDPMRTYFDVDFEPTYYGANPTQTPPDYDPSFSFLGHTGTGSNLEDFGKHIAEHPYFATGWVQKMCAFANADECDEDTSEFQRIVKVFEDSNLNFKTMITELFSSTLVTNTPSAEDADDQFKPISLSRLDHFCPTLAARTGIEDICSLNSTETLASALPADLWSRGSDKADQATDPGMFYRATINNLCSDISTALYDDTESPLQKSDIEGSLDWLTESFMGISQTDPRFSTIRAILQGHYDDIGDEVDTSIRLRLESVATLACVSPFLTSIDY